MPASRDTRAQDWLPALILALLLAALWGWFVPQATEAAAMPPAFDTWDFHNFFLPRYVFGSQEVLAGRLPLWNPLEFAGMPFLATLQPAALYPPKILAFACLRPEAAMQTFLISHYALLIGGFLLFLRSQSIRGLGALAGTAFLAFNSSVLMADHHPFRIANFAWIPITFWLADRVAQSQRRAPIAALALVVAMQLLVGYPEFTLHVALLLGVQSIAMWSIGAWPSAPWRTLPRLALGFVLGALLAAIQLVPFAELVLESQRSAAAQTWVEQQSGIIAGSLPWPQLVGLLLGLFGGLSLFWVGSLPLRRSLPPLASSVFIRLMGTHGWRWLRELPILSGIRHGLMWLLTAQFVIAWLVALGADAFAQRSGSGARDRFSAWTIGALAALWCAVCLAALVLPPAAAAAPGASVGALREIVGGVAGGPLAKTAGAIGALLVVASACLVRATPKRNGLAIAGVSLIALGQIAAYPIQTAVSPFRPFASETRLGALRPPSAPALTGRVFSIEDLRWGSTFYDRVPNVFGLETSFPPKRFHALQDQLGFEANFSQLNWPAFGGAEGFLDALDVEWVVAPWLVAPALPEANWERAPQNPSHAALLHNRERPGRAWVAYAASVAPSEQAALDRLLSPGFDPRREVILEAPLASVGAAPASDLPTAARTTVVSPTQVEVEAELPRPGILVLSEAWFPGWVATVDDAPAEILRADFVLRGVALGAGSHRVRFEYRPRSVTIGAGLTLLGVFGMLALVASDRRRREVES